MIPAGGRAARGRGCGWLAVVLVAVRPLVAAEGPWAVLELPGGGRVPGQFVGGGRAGDDGTATVRIETDTFAGPLDFCIDAFARIRFEPPPRPATGPTGRVDLRGGDVVAGEVDTTDAERLTVAVPGVGPIVIRRDAVARVAGAESAGEREPEDSPPPRQPPPRDAVVAVLGGGTRLTGEILGLAAGTLRLACPAVEKPVAIPVAALVALEAARVGDVRGLPGTVGRLTAGDATMIGCLADVGGAVGWQPLGASSAVAFAGPDVAARIAYRGLGALGGVGVSVARRGDDAWEIVDVVAGGPAARDGRLRPGDLVAGVAEGSAGEAVRTGGLKVDAVRALLRGPVGSTARLGIVSGTGARTEVCIVRDESGRDDLAGAAAKDVLDRAIALQQSLARTPAPGGPATVHLRHGDAIACTLVAADPETVTVRLAADREAVVPARLVRAIELSPAGVRPLSRQKLARLLTVPRAQQGSPPTHVLRMMAGDYLRGRLLAVDATTVRFDVAGDVKELPRRDVARIIRLVAADEPPPEPRAALAGMAGLPIVAVGADGRRLALAATGVAGGMLVGTSPACGALRLPLDRYAEVLVGRAIDGARPGEQPYAQWVLTPAPAPSRAGR